MSRLDGVRGGWFEVGLHRGGGVDGVGSWKLFLVAGFACWVGSVPWGVGRLCRLTPSGVGPWEQ